MTTTEELDSAWSGIETPRTAGVMAGRPAPGVAADRGISLAVDHDGLRHLLVAAPEGTPQPRPTTTQGLEVGLDQLQVGAHAARQYLDVACRDATMNANFSMVASEIVTALADDQGAPSRTLERILRRWRWFWGAPADGLAEEQVIGLFGELWFLEFWMGPLTEGTLSTWRGPFRDRHDFTWSAFSVEVKATRGRTDGAAKHRITSLDQLEDPAEGRLHLFSLRVTPDPIGAHSLVASIDRIRLSLEGDQDARRSFDELLGRSGYSPAHREKYTATLRVTAEELYVVRDAFPRLHPASFPGGVPAGVGDIAYTLDLAACQPWRVATGPDAAAMEELRASLGTTAGE